MLNSVGGWWNEVTSGLVVAPADGACDCHEARAVPAGLKQRGCRISLRVRVNEGSCEWRLRPSLNNFLMLGVVACGKALARGTSVCSQRICLVPQFVCILFRGVRFSTLRYRDVSIGFTVPLCVRRFKGLSIRD